MVRTPRQRDAEPHALAALATALLLPALMGVWVLVWRGSHDTPRPRASTVVTHLVFLPPRAMPAAVSTAVPRGDPPPAAPQVRVPASPPRSDTATRDALHVQLDAAPPAPGVALDYGNLLGDPPIAIAETLPWARTASRTEAAPERFRMRRQVTPADVVRGFSQLVGLWPPGYTESPCPALRRTIDSLSQAPSLGTRDHALLQDAILARSRYCA
ncbi:MAG: hypothetical protein ABW163_11685 [Luteimonas sp.]